MRQQNAAERAGILFSSPQADVESGRRIDLCLSASQKGCSGADCEDCVTLRARSTTLCDAQASSRAWLCFAGGCLHGPGASGGCIGRMRIGSYRHDAGRIYQWAALSSEVWISGVVIWPAMLPLKLSSQLATRSHKTTESVGLEEVGSGRDIMSRSLRIAGSEQSRPRFHLHLPRSGS